MQYYINKNWTDMIIAWIFILYNKYVISAEFTLHFKIIAYTTDRHHHLDLIFGDMIGDI